MITLPDPSLPFLSHSLEDTQKFGRALARILKPGDVLGIVGDLGAGKTQLVKVICEAWGIPKNSVTSPTFTLVHEYQGHDTNLCSQKIAHSDLYRLESTFEFESLDLASYCEDGAILLVEWADKFWSHLPGTPKRVEMHIVGENERLIQLF